MVSAQICESKNDNHLPLQPHTQDISYQPIPDEGLFKFDATIVFGEGPIKPILLAHEISQEQQIEWDNFKANPYRFKEPSFWLMQQPRQLGHLAKIDYIPDLTVEEKAQLKEKKIIEWQRTGWFALRIWGRQNALAAGCALYTGLTKEVILSGGRTISPATRERLSKTRLDAWPSEAELMADIIKTHYGALYEKKYGRSIMDVITIEDKAMTTLENFAYSIQKHPDIVSEGKHVGLLTARHHLKRVSILANIFSIRNADESKLCAQEILISNDVAQERPILVEQNEEQDVREFVKHYDQNPRIKELETKEELSIKGLLDPQYLTYWFGYLGDVKNPKIIQRAMRKFEDPQWCEVGQNVFKQIGLNMDDYRSEDLSELSKKHPEKYYVLIEGLKKLKQAPYRTYPHSTH